MNRLNRIGTLRRAGAALGRTIAMVAALAAAACGGGGGDTDEAVARGSARGAPPENHATPDAPTIQHPSVATVTDSSCPATGRWTPCHLVKRLEQAGLVADTSHEDVTEPPLAARGKEMTVRQARMELYFYPDRAARERDEARLDRSRYLAAEQPPEPRHKPTLVTSENLLVVLDTRNERQRERITLTITAGPPQAPAP